MTTVYPLTFGSHVSIRLGEYWFSGKGNPEGCTKLSDSSGVGISTSSASTYVLNSPTKSTGDYVMFGDLMTLTDLSNGSVMQITSDKCVLWEVSTKENSQPLMIAIQDMVGGPTSPGVYQAPQWTSFSQPQVSYPFMTTAAAYYVQYASPVQLGFLRPSTAKGGRVEIYSKATGNQPSIYVVSYQPPNANPNPPPPNNVPSVPYVPMPPAPPTPVSPDILYASIGVGVLGLVVLGYGWQTRKNTMLYAGGVLVVGGGGGLIYYLVKKKKSSS